MFIIERRTAGVLAALATTAAMVILGNVSDAIEHDAARSSAASVMSAVPNITHDRLLAAGQPVADRPR